MAENITFPQLRLRAVIMIPKQLDQHQICKPVMVSVVSSSPTGDNFIFLRHIDANFVKKKKTVPFYLAYGLLSFQSIGRFS